jgi:hypothetical protein
MSVVITTDAVVVGESRRPVVVVVVDGEHLFWERRPGYTAETEPGELDDVSRAGGGHVEEIATGSVPLHLACLPRKCADGQHPSLQQFIITSPHLQMHRKLQHHPQDGFFFGRFSAFPLSLLRNGTQRVCGVGLLHPAVWQVVRWSDKGSPPTNLQAGRPCIVPFFVIPGKKWIHDLQTAGGKNHEQPTLSKKSNKVLFLR